MFKSNIILCYVYWAPKQTLDFIADLLLSLSLVCLCLISENICSGSVVDHMCSVLLVTFGVVVVRQAMAFNQSMCFITVKQEWEKRYIIVWSIYEK